MSEDNIVVAEEVVLGVGATFIPRELLNQIFEAFAELMGEEVSTEGLSSIVSE